MKTLDTLSNGVRQQILTENSQKIKKGASSSNVSDLVSNTNLTLTLAEQLTLQTKP
jgi:hypothetical protein